MLGRHVVTVTPPAGRRRRGGATAFAPRSGRPTTRPGDGREPVWLRSAAKSFQAVAAARHGCRPDASGSPRGTSRSRAHRTTASRGTSRSRGRRCGSRASSSKRCAAAATDRCTGRRTAHSRAAARASPPSTTTAPASTQGCSPRASPQAGTATGTSRQITRCNARSETSSPPRAVSTHPRFARRSTAAACRCSPCPWSAAARMFAALATPGAVPLPKAVSRHLLSIAAAQRAAPWMVGGTGRADTALIRATGGRMLSKVGAEGLWSIGRRRHRRRARAEVRGRVERRRVPGGPGVAACRRRTGRPRVCRPPPPPRLDPPQPRGTRRRTRAGRRPASARRRTAGGRSPRAPLVNDARPLPRLPCRARDAHKGTAGHVLVVAGSSTYPRRSRSGGAGRDALRPRAWFTVFTPAPARPRVAALLASEMTVPTASRRHRRVHGRGAPRRARHGRHRRCRGARSRAGAQRCDAGIRTRAA